MFREMRLKDNQLPQEESMAMLASCTHGTLAVSGDDGYPYAVPVSYAYTEGKIYFHGSSAAGHKLDALKRNEKVSFCVIEKDEILPSEFNTLYRSVIAFGRARILDSDAEKRKAVDYILAKYSTNFMESGRKYAESQWDDFVVVEITIDHLTGKKGT